jgi:hypothetical protein
MNEASKDKRDLSQPSQRLKSPSQRLKSMSIDSSDGHTPIAFVGKNSIQSDNGSFGLRVFPVFWITATAFPVNHLQ